ncbi:NAD(P)-dependent oxidoreductase [Microbacterium sp. 1.5R]|uniref:NAD(P)-dependent oxidoreductase n=1 Tax=Microbacterium sp. 1.5R TaxID=1916917 RepID=UPI0011A73D10|nr:NAD(P)-dependent oxidoreductase [Microbacterium sp. 1.5R]
MPGSSEYATTVAVIGLGAMGRPIAAHVAAAGFPVVGWDSDATVRSEALGIRLGEDLASTVRGADLSLIVVGSESAVEAVVRSGSTEMSEGGVQVILGTIGPALADSLVAVGRAAGRPVLNAPLCRAARGVQNASALALVSGDADSLDYARHVLAAFCSDIEYLGDEPAHAQVAKAANNLMLWASVAANEEAFRLAEAFGLDVEALRRALTTSTGDSWSLREWEHVAEWTWSQKDLRVYGEMADRIGVEAPLARQLAVLARSSRHLTHAHDSHDSHDRNENDD